MPETFRPAFADRDHPKISYGVPFPEACARHVTETFRASRPYIICSKTLGTKTQQLQRLKDALGGTVVGVRVGMQSHTLWSEVLEIVHEARAAKADILITLGAGSLTDAAKIVSFALANDVTNEDELMSLTVDAANKKPDMVGGQIPIICIPTSLSGGEYSHFAGGTRDSTRRKHSFQKPNKGPSLIILDPALAQTTPDSIWLSTGIRAVDHCVETLCALESNAAADADAERGLGQLISGLLRCKHNHEDRDAFLLCQLGCVDAMSACSGGVMLGASHGIGHQLGPMGVGHGETSCILLPAVCKWNASKGANVERQAAVIKILWHDAEAAAIFAKKGLKRDSADLGDLMRAIIDELGMPASLAEVGVGRDKLDTLAAHSLHDRWCQSNPVPLVRKEQVLEILEMVVERRD